MIEARIIADSVSPAGSRLTTFVLTYPRFIHSEVMTHRMFSRNAASSRAIPIKRMLSSIKTDPAMPVHWGGNGKGMQAHGELSGFRKWFAVRIWLLSMRLACFMVWCLNKLGLHKQVANRITEPWAHMTTIVTATEWKNFFSLRAHPDAQPEFQELAYQMLEAYLSNEPKQLKDGEWHLPFADKYADDLSVPQLVKITTARCARVSYKTFEGDIDHEKDYDLHDKLLTSGHLSPFEHAAQAGQSDRFSGNLRGFVQYRKLIQNENRTDVDLQSILEQRRAHRAA